MSDELGVQEEQGVLRVNEGLAIPRGELQFRTSRSGGPGGQNVNKVETRVELLFDLAGSSSLAEEQRERLRAGMQPWLDDAGTVHVVSDRFRSQHCNREDVVERFVTLVRAALRPRKRRKATRVPAGVKEARIRAKRHRARTKSERSSVGSDQ